LSGAGFSDIQKKLVKGGELNRAIARSWLWPAFYVLILWAWWVMFSMCRNMDLDLIGRPGPMAQALEAMDPRMAMYMPMAEFGPLFWMVAIMMTAIMMPTLVPTLRSYDDVITIANR